MLAHPIPKPVIATKSKFLSAMCGNAKKPAAAKTKQTKCTYLAPYFRANPTRAKAVQQRIVLRLRQRVVAPRGDDVDAGTGDVGLEDVAVGQIGPA